MAQMYSTNCVTISLNLNGKSIPHTYLSGTLYFSSSMHFVFLVQMSDLSKSEDGPRGGKLNNNFISPPGALMIFEGTNTYNQEQMTVWLILQMHQCLLLSNKFTCHRAVNIAVWWYYSEDRVTHLIALDLNWNFVNRHWWIKEKTPFFSTEE